MNQYQERSLKEINESIKFNKLVLEEIEKRYKDYSFGSIDFAVSKYAVNAKIAKEEDILEVYTYAIEAFNEISEKLGVEITSFKLCDLVSLSVDVLNGGFIRLYFSLDGEIHNKLYDQVFGSHSGIGEWVSDTVPVLMDPIVGSSSYCHAFGTFSMLSIVNFFKNFNEWYDSEKNHYYNSEERANHVEQAKKIIDWLKAWTLNDSEIKTKFGNIYKSYIDVVLGANPEDY